MEQTNKDLLLKDICARLPYGIKVSVDNNTWCDFCKDIPYEITLENSYRILLGATLGYVKPYLFPLSSMNEEQKEELKDEISKQTEILIERMKNDDCGIDCGKYHFHSTLELEWLLKNHFDFRGLISKGLAINAIGLNIY